MDAPVRASSPSAGIDFSDLPLDLGLEGLAYNPEITQMQGRIAQLESDLAEQTQSANQLAHLIALSSQQSAAIVQRIQAQAEHLMTLNETLQEKVDHLGERIVKLETLTRESLPKQQMSSEEE